MSYEKLLEELNAAGTKMNKALAIDPAAEGEGEGEGDDEAAAAAAAAKLKKDGKMAKSFQVVLENGDKVQAFDGSEIVENLIKRTNSMGTAMAKAIAVVQAIGDAHSETIKQNDTLVKSNEALTKTVEELRKSVESIGDVGRGRKSVVQMIGADPEGTENGKKGVTTGEFMNKSMTAMKAGRISGGEATRINALINNNKPIPEELVSKVLTA